MEKNTDTHIFKLATPEGFDEWFYQYCQHYKGSEAAYEAVETVRERYFGERMYANYRSYSVSRNARLKRKSNPPS